jgi:transposase
MDDGWRMPDELWAKMKRLVPVHRVKHPLGCHGQRVGDRSSMDAILFVLRRGYQWNAFNATAIFSSFSAHRRF